MSDRVRFEVDDAGVGILTLNRPDKLNALDQAVFDGLHEAAAQAEHVTASGACRAVLIRGEGRAFSSGLDVSLFGGQAAGELPTDSWIDHLQSAFTRWEDLRVPVVAALQGPVFGGGCQLALAAHLRVAAPDAQIALLEARWALIPDLGGLTRLPRLIGLSRATDMAMTARVVDAETALDWGLVDRVVGQEELGEAAHTFAAQLAAGPTRAIGAVPGLLRRSLVSDREAMLRAERDHQRTVCLTSADFVEAATAAAQKRPPEFTGT